jgi:hypothetical protein
MIVTRQPKRRAKGQVLAALGTAKDKRFKPFWLRHGELHVLTDRYLGRPSPRGEFAPVSAKVRGPPVKR